MKYVVSISNAHAIIQVIRTVEAASARDAVVAVERNYDCSIGSYSIDPENDHLVHTMLNATELEAFTLARQFEHRTGVGTIPCQYCGEVTCDYSCDESQAGGFTQPAQANTPKEIRHVYVVLRIDVKVPPASTAEYVDAILNETTFTADHADIAGVEVIENQYPYTQTR